jgi:PDZ domain-containing protein
MSRSRNVAALLALAVLLVLLGVLFLTPVSYTIYRPGPTFDVLGKNGSKDLIAVGGRKTYRDDGQLRMVTIIESQPKEKISLFEALGAWLNPKDDLYPTSAVYPPDTSNQQATQQDAQEMVSSQDDAVAAALTLLGVHYTSSTSATEVESGSPAAGKLKAGDLILAVNGKRMSGPNAVVKAVRPLSPGSTVKIEVQRGSTIRTVTLMTVAAGTSGAAANQSRVGVVLSPSFRFPFPVKLNVASNIGGPSAGMMFALGIYDTLTPGSLTHGRTIAGTGTIAPNGAVGEIGGIQQKIPGAQHDGAKLFLVPAGNCAEALKADYDPKKMRLAKVSTLEGALAVVEAWSKNPDVALPRCTP